MPNTDTETRAPDGFPPAVSVEAVSSEVRAVIVRATWTIVVALAFNAVLLGLILWRLVALREMVLALH